MFLRLSLQNVKEISGTTVNDHITSFFTKKSAICQLSDLTIGEIADYLHFNDQECIDQFLQNKEVTTCLSSMQVDMISVTWP